MITLELNIIGVKNKYNTNASSKQIYYKCPHMIEKNKFIRDDQKKLWIHQLNLELIYPPYSPDLALSHYCSFPFLQNNL